jgi:hypothetical protein
MIQKERIQQFNEQLLQSGDYVVKDATITTCF